MAAGGKGECKGRRKVEGGRWTMKRRYNKKREERH